MKISEIKVETEVELLVSGEKGGRNFESIVKQVLGDRILIEAIENDGMTVGFEKLRVDFLYKSEGKVYRWDEVEVVLVKYKDEVYHMVRTENPIGVQFNRRGAYRVFVGTYMNAIIKIIGDQRKQVEIMIKDISATGLSFVSEFEIDDTLPVIIRLEDEGYKYDLTGKLVRRNFQDNLGKYVYGMMFTAGHKNLSPYIMKKQSLRRKTEGKSLTNDIKKK